MSIEEKKLAIIGLGYVGLPLAVAFAKKMDIVGFDISQERITELLNGQDSTLEVSPDDLIDKKNLQFTNKSKDLEDVDIYIVTVPTPVDANKEPLLKPLESACKTVASRLSPGNIVIYESTVYPGATEEVCVPILEEISGLQFNKDFYVGYSPERINPGDKTHRLENIIKVTSGSTEKIADEVDELYRLVIDAGTHRASSIKVAEAAKVIENTQRDLNIALINELAQIFNRMGIDTLDVLEAAGSKWNFLPFRPGLVGGHCIGVDPYYLTYKAQKIGYSPDVILAGRKINDSMAVYVSQRVQSLLAANGIDTSKVTASILVLGLAFKENCPDVRNTKVVDIIDDLIQAGADIDVYDPWVDVIEAEAAYDVKVIESLDQGKKYDAIILAVAHKEFLEINLEQFGSLLKDNGIIYDVKSALPKALVTERL